MIMSDIPSSYNSIRFSSTQRQPVPSKLEEFDEKISVRTETNLEEILVGWFKLKLPGLVNNTCANHRYFVKEL